MCSTRAKVIRNLIVLFHLGHLTICQGTNSGPFKGCDHIFEIKPGISHLESPDFPAPYPPNTACRYKFVAPTDYGITVKCSINMTKGANGCTTEYFYFARDGDQQLRGSEQLCGAGTFTRKSLFSSVTLAYISYGSTGYFNCSLEVQRRPCDCGWSVNTKIVNGEETSVNEYPAMVALRDKTSKKHLFCSATIISPTYLLTAAHCVRVQPNPAYIEVLVGRHNIETTVDTQYADIYNISEIIEHPDYTPDPTNNDIALLRTSTAIEFRRGVGPACLPPVSNINNDFSYDNVDVIGWGALGFANGNSPTLQKVTLLVVENKVCQQVFQNQDIIYPSQICTYDSTGNSKDSCQYDSGGPVIFKHKNRQFLIGIISFGKSCGEGKYSMGVNTRITSYLYWIYQNTEYSTCYVEL